MFQLEVFSMYGPVMPLIPQKGDFGIVPVATALGGASGRGYPAAQGSVMWRVAREGLGGLYCKVLRRAGKVRCFL